MTAPSILAEPPTVQELNQALAIHPRPFVFHPSERGNRFDNDHAWARVLDAFGVPVSGYRMSWQINYVSGAHSGAGCGGSIVSCASTGAIWCPFSLRWEEEVDTVAARLREKKEGIPRDDRNYSFAYHPGACLAPDNAGDIETHWASDFVALVLRARFDAVPEAQEPGQARLRL
jgi:hypothetical protein